MTKAIEYEDSSFAITNSSEQITDIYKDDDGNIIEQHGHVATPNGYVSFSIYNYPHRKIYGVNLWFIFASRYYLRKYEKPMSVRGLVTKANRFAREIVERNK